MPEPVEMSRNKSGLSHLRRRTVVSLLRTWREVKGTAHHAIGGEIRASLPREDMDHLKKQMQLCLDSPGGEITARANTASLGRTYLNLNDVGRTKFLKLLATDFDINPQALAELTASYAAAQTDIEKFKLETSLRQALITPRSNILKQFTALPEGFKFLVNMRADLLAIMGKDNRLKGLELDLKAILTAWFDISLLDLVEISWNSPAALLEKIMEYEAVHRVASWNDLKNRLDADRRVFAFCHHKMPLEPLIFVHVALVDGMSDNIQQLLDEKTPVFDVDKADTAIFYSISNAQKGLAGISFGNFLIKRVVSVLAEEMQQVKTFATLSPIPGFRAWLNPKLQEDANNSMLSAGEMDSLVPWLGGETTASGLYQILESDWASDSKLALALKPILLRLCAHYLLEEKKSGQLPLDPVANFHLYNGARLERINWLGDSSVKGMRQSAGLMVNYHYKLSHIDENHEEFAAHGKIIASRQVRGYLK